MADSNSEEKVKAKVWRSESLKSMTDSWSGLATTDRTQLAFMTLQPGESSGEFSNEHAGSDQWLLVLEGTGEVRTEEGREEIAAGDIVLVPAPEKHQFTCTGSSALKTINIYGPVAYPQ